MGRYITSDPVGLQGTLNTYLYANGNPTAFIDPDGLLFGIPAGEAFGSSAAQYWANRQIATGNPLYSIPGGLAALWTPETSNDTVLTLLGGYAARLFGPFRTQGLPRRLQRLRKYFRFDPPQHRKGYEFDGTFPKWLRKRFKNNKIFLIFYSPSFNGSKQTDTDIQNNNCQ